jgi:hypothetical protein
MCSLIRICSAMTALQGAEGGKGLVRVYRASEDGVAGEVLALPLKIFESNEQQARAVVWRPPGLQEPMQDAFSSLNVFSDEECSLIGMCSLMNAGTCCIWRPQGGDGRGGIKPPTRC